MLRVCQGKQGHVCSFALGRVISAIKEVSLNGWCQGLYEQLFPTPGPLSSGTLNKVTLIALQQQQK
jgi:hypothetical protein